MCEGKCHKKDFPQVTHCIFDLDGTLLDTEPVYNRVYDEMIKEHGKEYTLELNEQIRGTTTENAWKIICTELKLDIPLNILKDDFNKRCYEPLGWCPVMPGAERVLHYFNKQKIPMAIATSSTETSVKRKSERYQELFSIFDHIVCGGSDPEVKQAKPNPDIFLTCANRFPAKPHPSECLVFEDAINGVTAAVRAGMQCIAIPDKQIPRKLFNHAALILDSLDDFQPTHFGLPHYETSG